MAEIVELNVERNPRFVRYWRNDEFRVWGVAVCDQYEMLWSEPEWIPRKRDAIKAAKETAAGYGLPPDAVEETDWEPRPVVEPQYSPGSF